MKDLVELMELLREKYLSKTLEEGFSYFFPGEIKLEEKPADYTLSLRPDPLEEEKEILQKILGHNLYDY